MVSIISTTPPIIFFFFNKIVIRYFSPSESFKVNLKAVYPVLVAAMEISFPAGIVILKLPFASVYIASLLPT